MKRVTLTLTEYEVLSRALVVVVDRLAIPHAKLADLLGTSRGSVRSFLAGTSVLLRRTEVHTELVDLLYMYQTLLAVSGDDVDNARRWFHGDNTALLGAPVDLVASREGLDRVNGYLAGLATR